MDSGGLKVACLLVCGAILLQSQNRICSFGSHRVILFYVGASVKFWCPGTPLGFALASSHPASWHQEGNTRLGEDPLRVIQLWSQTCFQAEKSPAPIRIQPYSNLRDQPPHLPADLPDHWVLRTPKTSSTFWHILNSWPIWKGAQKRDIGSPARWEST